LKFVIIGILIYFLELAAKGAEVVKVDLRDLASVEKALAGAYGLFGVTNCA
jgi:uncharacterized protein YbjT (DUF2867 family)